VPYRTRLILALATAGLTFAAALPAAAQSETVADEDIVVTAPERDREAVRDQASAIAGTERSRDPLARFQDSVCPGVIGLRPEFATAIADRMRFNAERLGLNLRDAGECDANVLVYFVPGVDAVMAGMFANDAVTRSNFVTLSDRERRLLKNERGPTRAWSITSRRSADGLLEQIGKVVEIRDTGRIQIGTREDLEVSIVLIDLNAIAGLTTQQLADYATMRALAETREPREAGKLGTILTLFASDGDRAGELTPFDLAYLGNLYSGSANVESSRKLGGVAAQLERGPSAPSSR
jgi:hypothetical protein